MSKTTVPFINSVRFRVGTDTFFLTLEVIQMLPRHLEVVKIEDGTGELVCRIPLANPNRAELADKAIKVKTKNWRCDVAKFVEETIQYLAGYASGGK